MSVRLVRSDFGDGDGMRQELESQSIPLPRSTAKKIFVNAPIIIAVALAVPALLHDAAAALNTAFGWAGVIAVMNFALMGAGYGSGFTRRELQNPLFTKLKYSLGGS